MAILNMMEMMVDFRMEEHLKKHDCCKCEMCLEDMKCMALNKLPPKYASNPKGALFTKMSQQMDRQHIMDIDVAVINAIEFVSKKPRHD